MTDIDTTPTRTPFWQEQVELAKNSRSSQADPAACGTCRDLAADGKPVEHDGCAARAMLLEAPDLPSWEVIVEMTAEEKAELPARFHIPRFDDLGKPNAWLCAVCWGDGWVTGWPCTTAQKHGTEIFTPDHEAERHRQQRNARITELEMQVVALTAERDQALEDVADLERALGLNEEAA